MSRYNIDYPHLAIPAENAGPFHPSSKNDRHDERGSQSGSDDGASYLHYPDTQKNETDPEEDSNASLTSQTLNADGTPKRPMNAFMIFARRRRPQVSAENQSMRTGEISKILSREWNSMEPQDKQFYLDQAKSLKENFNTKYPDYVYRRRPNNSRKRRRTDGGVNRSGDNPLPSDPGDDLAGIGDLGEPSPTEGDDSLPDSGVDVQYSRIPHDASSNYSDHGNFATQPRTSAYPYPPSDLAYRSSHETRHPFITSAHERISQEVPPTTSLGSPRLSQPGQQTHHYPYLPTSNHSQPSPLYTAEQNDGHANWDSRPESGRTAPSGWLGSSNDRSLSSLAGPKPHSYSPTSPQSGWSNSSPGPVTPAGTSPSHTANFPFPTLNSPFYPNQAQLQGSYPNTTSSPTSHSSSSPSQYNSTSTNHIPASSMAGRGYEHRAYAPSPSISPANPYPSTSTRESQLYPRHSGIPRGLPPVQSISSLHSHSMQHSPPSSGPITSQIGYWARDKLEE